MTETPIIMTWPDHAQLTAMVESRRNRKNGQDGVALERLATELARARLVAAQDIPADVVTMNTRAKVRDLDSDEVFSFALSWPDQADAGLARINVLAPLGMALLGCRTGQEVEWPVPGGTRRLRVEGVLQPESGSPPEAC
jgi:regulator of nucleoside diphosphate kinase